MTILTLGCSWTYGLGVEANETYSAHLQNITGDKVINGGYPGIDWAFISMIGQRLIDIHKPDVVIVQLTTLDRFTYSLDGRNNFLNNEYLSNSTFDFVPDNNSKYIRYKTIGDISLELLTAGSYTNKSILKSKLYEEYVFSNLRTLQFISQVKLFKNYCPKNSIFFSWTRLPYILRQEIGFVEPSSIMEEFGETYCIDNGYHYNNEGNKLVAKRLAKLL